MAYMKDPFESWLATLQRTNGEPYAQATITNYVRAIQGFCLATYTTEKLD